MSRRNGGIIGPTNTPVGGLMTGVAGGVWRMNDVLTFVSNNQWPSGPQNIDNSCRFEDDSNDYLVKTFVTPTNQYLYTISMWVKRSLLGSNQTLFGVGDDGSNNATLKFTSDDQIQIYDHISGVDKLQKKTNMLFRDTSAWYHIFVSSDRSISSPSTQIYINGVQVTSFAANTEYSQNDSGKFNTAVNHYLGVYTNNSEKLSGYIAEAVFVDGLALAHTDFGETDSTTGIWKPKKIGKLGDVGNNTFYLDFKDSSSLGNDASGKNNDFTATNLTSIDQSTDTCVENFCTWNPLYIRQTIKPAYSEGNLDVLHDNSSFNEGAIGTISSDSGKWYAEFKVEAVGGNCNLGIIDIDNTTATDTLNVGFIYKSDGNKRVSGSDSSYGDSYTTNDIIGMAMDLDNSKVYFSKNGTFQNSGDPTSGSTGTGAISITAGKFYTWFSSNYQNGSIVMNAGSPSFAISSGNSDANGFGNFEYSVPSGYYALNTTNLNTYG
jgi:hypothetical protein